MRVHKSYIVSLDKIRAPDGNRIFFKGTNTFVPLGDTYRPAFFEALEVLGSRK